MVGLIALSVAVGLDLVFGDPPNRFHPVVAMGSLIRWGMDRAPQAGAARQLLFGSAWILFGGSLFALPWVLLGGWISPLPAWAQGLILGILLKPVFSLRRLLEAGRNVQAALQDGNLPDARRLVAWHLVSRDTASLDAGQVASATIESLAENLTDSFFAPLLAFAIGGVPLAWFYRFANTADAMIGYHTPQFEYLGKFAARLDDVLNWLPARLAALLVVAAGGVCGLKPSRGLKPSLGLKPSGAWRTMLAYHSRTSSPNAGWTMAAAAGALSVRLEKIGHYCLEGGRELPSAEDIHRAAVLVVVGAGLCFVVCSGVIYGIVRFF
jgi:adenosylcobinamide-phosphate synthase